MPTEHKDFHGCSITARHLGLTGNAWVTHAWDDWYYCHVLGTWANGNKAEGILCRERADVIRQYLINGDSGGPKLSPFFKGGQA